jgi:hypothetical protein
LVEDDGRLFFQLLLNEASEGLAGHADLGLVFLLAIFAFLGFDFLNLYLFNECGDWDWLGNGLFFRHNYERIQVLRLRLLDHDLGNHLWWLRLGFLLNLFHENWRLDHFNWLYDDLGSGLRIVDDELNFFVAGESDAVGHLEVTVIFDADLFVVSIVVADGERSFLINSFLGGHLAGGVKNFFDGLEGKNAFDGRLALACESELDVKLAEFLGVHFYFGSKMFDWVFDC